MLYFEILILWSITESIIQPERFPKNFCMFDVLVVYIDSSTSSTSLSLITPSAFDCEKRCHILSYHHFLSF